MAEKRSRKILLTIQRVIVCITIFGLTFDL